MEKDWKEKKQILNAEIRTLIIARLLSCVVIAGLLLGVLPFLGSNFTSWCYVECKFYRRGVDNLRV